MVDLRFPFDDLRGKTAVVTGSARGIGLSTAHALADVGMTVLLVDRDEQELAQAVKGFPDQSRFAAVAADLASDAATPDLTEALRNLPPLAVWVNNAGRTSHQAAAEVDLSEFERVIRDNTTSALRCSQVAYRGFRTANAGGAIVNVCSLTTERVLPDRLSYATSKAALESITRYSAVSVSTLSRPATSRRGKRSGRLTTLERSLNSARSLNCRCAAPASPPILRGPFYI
jgi:NAD(P)-dependent dehydrogenase (short-subunit alcohol dehydrogenase family)